MIPQTVFTKMNSLNLTSEQSVGVSQMLFETAEAMTQKTESAIDKMMDRMEETISKMNASFGRMIIEVVEATEKKIFARIAQETADLEEKKRLKREELAARKAAKAQQAAQNAHQEEGVVVAAGGRFQEESTADPAGAAAIGENSERETGGVDGQDVRPKQASETQQSEASESRPAENVSAAQKNLNLIPMKKTYETLRDAVCELDDLYKEQADQRGYGSFIEDPEWVAREMFLTDCEVKAQNAVYSEIYDNLHDQVTDEFGLFIDGWDDDRVLTEVNKELAVVAYDAAWVGRIEWERSQGRQIEIAS